MKTNGDVFRRCLLLVLGFFLIEGTWASPKKGKSGGSWGKSKGSNTGKKIGLGLAGAAVGAAGTAYVGHKLNKKLRKGFRDEDGHLSCWVCGIRGSVRCPQGEFGILMRKNSTNPSEDFNDDNQVPRYRGQDDADDDDNDLEDRYDSIFGSYMPCHENADSCLTLYSDHSQEKVLMRSCYDEGLFGCYDTMAGLPGFACFCRHDMCNHSNRWRPPGLPLILSSLLVGLLSVYVQIY